MQTVAETPTFTRQAAKLFNEDEKRELIDYLAENPLAGDEIPGTGGVRKLRFGALGRGKRGGARAIYFYGGERMPNASTPMRSPRRIRGSAALSHRIEAIGNAGTPPDEMSDFGEDLIRSLNEALAHAKGEGPAIVHAPVLPREVRKRAKLTQAQMAPLMGMSLSGYRKWEQGARQVSGPAAALLRVIQKEPEAVRRALTADG